MTLPKVYQYQRYYTKKCPDKVVVIQYLAQSCTNGNRDDLKWLIPNAIHINGYFLIVSKKIGTSFKLVSDLIEIYALLQNLQTQMERYDLGVRHAILCGKHIAWMFIVTNP